MSWHQDLVRIRDIDLARLDLHLTELSVTEYDYSQLLNQYVTLKERYQILLAQKAISERQLIDFQLSTEPLLAMTKKQKEELTNQLRNRKEDQKSNDSTNKMLKDRARLQADETNQVMRDMNLLTSTKNLLNAEHQNKLGESSQLRGAVSVLAARQIQLNESLNKHKYLLDNVTHELNILKKYERGTTIQLENFEELNKDLKQRVRGLLEREDLSNTRVQQMKRQVQNLTDIVRDKQIKVQQMYTRVSCAIQARDKELARGAILTRCVNEAQQKLDIKQSLLNTLKRQIGGLQYENCTTSDDNSRLAQLIRNSNLEIDSLMECTAQLMREIQEWLNEDVKVKAILNNKVDAYRGLLARFGKGSEAIYERSYKLAESRSTAMTIGSRIRRNI